MFENRASISAATLLTQEQPIKVKSTASDFARAVRLGAMGFTLRKPFYREDRANARGLSTRLAKITSALKKRGLAEGTRPQRRPPLRTTERLFSKVGTQSRITLSWDGQSRPGARLLPRTPPGSGRSCPGTRSSSSSPCTAGSTGSCRRGCSVGAAAGTRAARTAAPPRCTGMGRPRGPARTSPRSRTRSRSRPRSPSPGSPGTRTPPAAPAWALGPGPPRPGRRRGRGRVEHIPTVHPKQNSLILMHQPLHCNTVGSRDLRES